MLSIDAYYLRDVQLPCEFIVEHIVDQTLFSFVFIQKTFPGIFSVNSPTIKELKSTEDILKQGLNCDHGSCSHHCLMKLSLQFEVILEL